jgi:hypothetical protein
LSGKDDAPLIPTDPPTDAERACALMMFLTRLSENAERAQRLKTGSRLKGGEQEQHAVVPMTPQLNHPAGNDCNSPARTGGAFLFLVQLLLSFLVGLAIGNALLFVWDVIAPHLHALDPFDTRFGRW